MASLIPFQGSGGSGGANLRVPTGGLEKGTPRKTRMGVSPTCTCFPCRIPCLVIRRGSLVCKAPGKRRGIVTLSHDSQPWMGFWYIYHGIHCPLFLFFLLFSNLFPESHCITQAGFELIILLTQSPKCCNYKNVPTDPGSCCCLLYIGTYTHTHTYNTPISTHIYNAHTQNIHTYTHIHIHIIYISQTNNYLSTSKSYVYEHFTCVYISAE